jgi:4a-hydroxytetrahydrobiopterin dehydratase
MDRRLSRKEASDGVTDLGWRFVLGAVTTNVAVMTITEATEVAARVAAALGGADAHVHIDLRPDRVILSLRTPDIAWVSEADIAFASRISGVVEDLGLRTEPLDGPRPVQVLEIAIDAIDIGAVRPFWKAVLAYTDDPRVPDDLVDPVGQSPAIWFQQMDAPRPQRNRFHLDIAVPHDVAEQRVAAAVAAGGVLLSDADAPRFWVLADVEGNEACVTTWQGRD